MENSGIKNMTSVEGLNERTRKSNTAKSFVSLNSRYYTVSQKTGHAYYVL